MTLPPNIAPRIRINEAGCWIWTGCITENGYGLVRELGTKKNVRPHRLVWRLFHGRSIPDGMCVCHRCDVKRCIRPDHLFLGTPRENTHDAMRKGLLPRGEKHCAARLTADAVRAIRIARNVHGETLQTIANRYGVSVGAINGAATGVNWKHIDRPEATA